MSHCKTYALYTINIKMSIFYTKSKCFQRRIFRKTFRKNWEISKFMGTNFFKMVILIKPQLNHRHLENHSVFKKDVISEEIETKTFYE